jgi:hypothetical protein
MGVGMFENLRKYRYARIFCLLLSAGFLVAGYLFAGVWQILLIFPAALLLWVICKFQPEVCDPSVLFGGYTFLTAVGIWIRCEPHLIVYGFIMALVSWELHLFNRGLAGNPQYTDNLLLEKKHLRSLSIVIILSFLITTVGLSFHLDLPFGIIFVLVLVVGFAVERVYFYLFRENF